MSAGDDEKMDISTAIVPPLPPAAASDGDAIFANGAAAPARRLSVHFAPNNFEDSGGGGMSPPISSNRRMIVEPPPSPSRASALGVAPPAATAAADASSVDAISQFKRKLSQLSANGDAEALNGGAKSSENNKFRGGGGGSSSTADVGSLNGVSANGTRRFPTTTSTTTTMNGDGMNGVGASARRRPEPSAAARRLQHSSYGSDDDSDGDRIEFSDIRKRIGRPTTGTTAMLSERSRQVIDDSEHLLRSIQMRNRPKPPPGLTFSESMSAIPRSTAEIQASATRTHLRALRSLSPDGEPGACEATGAANRALLNTPKFKRIDFDDWIEDELDSRDRKPAWKMLEEKFASTNMDHANYNRMRRREQETDSPYTKFAHMDTESFTPRAPSWFASGFMAPRGMMRPLDTSGSGPYCAPAVDQSQGVELGEMSRYNRQISDVEARLLTRDARFLLPDTLKTITRRDFRHAPEPAPGSTSEGIVTEEELMNYLPRPYYSRPNRVDKDYFDFDLRHSVDMYRRPEGAYIPRGPQHWENKVLAEVKAKCDTPIAGYMFTSKDAPTDWRSMNSSYLSAALRTPSFWAQRFDKLGKQVRDSNPVSFQSLELNRPKPNKFTTYKDPEFDGLSDDD